MPSEPEALDYEGVFPIRRRHAQESDAAVEAWPAAAKRESFDEERIASTPASVFATENRDPATRLGAAYAVLTRRGHGASFFFLFIFSVVLYLRPYELIPALSSL